MRKRGGSNRFGYCLFALATGRVTQAFFSFFLFDSFSAITQLYELNSNELGGNKKLIGKALGGTFVGLSIVFLYFANARYFHAQYAMTQNQFPASRGAVLLGSASVLAVLVAMFVVIIADKN